MIRQMTIIVLGVAVGVLAAMIAPAVAGWSSAFIISCDMSGQCWLVNALVWTNPLGGCM